MKSTATNPSVAPKPSVGPFGTPTPMVGSLPPEVGGNSGLPAGVMPLPFEHPLHQLQREIHRHLPFGHPLAGLQKMMQPKLPAGHPLRAMQSKLLGRMK